MRSCVRAEIAAQRKQTTFINVFNRFRRYEKMKLILLGAPGAGKGTVAKMLSAHDGSVQISTGDILRGAVKAGTDLGKEAGAFMDRGDLVPDSLIMGIMEERLQQPDCGKGFLLDGFPRTIPQAEALRDLLARIGVSIQLAVNIDVPREVILDRLTTRRTCSNPECQEIYNIKSKPPGEDGVCLKCGSPTVQRADETVEAINKRLETYNEKTAPLTAFYEKEGILLTTRSTSSEGVIADITKALSS
jgi:adenylate kinase